MKKLLEYYKEEDGVAAVVVAFLMVIIMSFTAFAVDLGMYYMKKGQLQTACDSAALAAVYCLPDTTQATETALSYITKNGFSTTDVTISFSNNNKAISITSAQQQKTYFANIFGIKFMNYKCKSTGCVSIKPAGGAFDYLIFSGSRTSTLEMKANFHIYGSVHTNYNFSTSYNNGYIMGACEAMGWVYLSQGTTVGQKVEGAPFVPMADFTKVINQMVPTTFDHVYTPAQVNAMSQNGCVTFSGRTLITGSVTIPKGMINNGSLVVQGSLQVYGGNVPGADGNTCCLQSDNGVLYATNYIYMAKNFKGAGCVFAGGYIWLGGGNNIFTTRKAICLYSANGFIKMDCGGVDGYGLVYAPNGDIAVAGGNTTWHGSLIGYTISVIPSNITMYQNEVDLPFEIGSRTAILYEPVPTTS